jgi:hypothetical protein
MVFSAGREYQTVEYANHVLNVPYLMVYQWVSSFFTVLARYAAGTDT